MDKYAFAEGSYRCGVSYNCIYITMPASLSNYFYKLGRLFKPGSETLWPVWIYRFVCIETINLDKVM